MVCKYTDEGEDPPHSPTQPPQTQRYWEGRSQPLNPLRDLAKLYGSVGNDHTLETSLPFCQYTFQPVRDFGDNLDLTERGN